MFLEDYFSHAITLTSYVVDIGLSGGRRYHFVLPSGSIIKLVPLNSLKNPIVGKARDRDWNHSPATANLNINIYLNKEGFRYKIFPKRLTESEWKTIKSIDLGDK